MSGFRLLLVKVIRIKTIYVKDLEFCFHLRTLNYEMLRYNPELINNGILTIIHSILEMHLGNYQLSNISNQEI